MRSLWGRSRGMRGRIARVVTCQCFTMTDMRTAKTISITLPPDLLAKAQEIADQEWSGLLERTRAEGASLGISSEADVERMSDEFRRSKRA
jgi:hypothetical protein